ncbi:MAG TPA: hypothetical protein VJ860_08900 [Polyangia bacterium]|jgi:hypothetical protein|nr:hypothetical protein [Polyangia bacterium]
MARNSSRRLSLLRWQYLRWALVIPALPLALWACNGHKLQTPTPLPQMETDFTVLVSPERNIDILFMVDNSPSMDPKQTALANNFPKMIAALEKLPGGLPDVHIGVVSSNMGAGNGAMGGNCGNGLGDRGLLWGNDPNDMTASVAAGSAYPVTPAGCGLNLGARWISDIQDPNNPGRIRNYDPATPLASVFSCLAKAVGVAGCGQEHQLQATRVALIPQVGINEANNGFLRPNAYLAIVLITDEDDCSADNNNDNNDNMFDMVGKRDVGDTTSLRCAARGHLCSGNPIPGYDPATVGYTSATPFTTPFANCTAKDQRDPSHPDHAFLPLYRVQDMIDSVNWVKGAQAKQKILVSGIIGWPPGPNDTAMPASVQRNDNYRIDKDATSLPDSQKNLWDYMPICWDPNQKSADNNIYKAYGGLRLKQFVDAFGEKGQVFSICNSDFTNAMVQIGNAIVQVLTPGCVTYPLIDSDGTTPITEPECVVFDRSPCSTPGSNGCLQSGYTETRLPECKDAQGKILDPSRLDPSLSNQQQVDALLDSSISQNSRPCWYLSYDNTKLGCQNVSYKGQRISALRKADTVAPPGTFLGMQCLTCASANQVCDPLVK